MKLADESASQQPLIAVFKRVQIEWYVTVWSHCLVNLISYNRRIPALLDELIYKLYKAVVDKCTHYRPTSGHQYPIVAMLLFYQLFTCQKADVILSPTLRSSKKEIAQFKPILGV